MNKLSVSMRKPWRAFHGLNLNSLAPKGYSCDFKNVISEHSLLLQIALRWMRGDVIDDCLTLVQVVVWCRQTTSHCLSQCLPRFEAVKCSWLPCPSLIKALTHSALNPEYSTSSIVSWVTPCLLTSSGHKLCWIYTITGSSFLTGKDLKCLHHNVDISL